MFKDPIVDEVHRIREENCKKFNYDLREIYKDIKNKEKEHKKRIIPAPIRKPKSKAA